MSDPSREQQPYDDEEPDFGSKLKVRLAIAGGLVALALAAIPILDSLTGKKASPADNSAGSIVSSNTPASAPVASAPVASAPVASAPVASAPVGTAPTGPNLAQTPGMTAAPALALPAPAPEAAAPAAGTAARPHRQSAPPPTGQPVVRDSRAFKPGSLPAQPYLAQPGARAPAQGLPAQQALQPVQPLPPQALASQPSRPPGTSVGYNVQLGLFNNLENAQKLISELRSKGIEVQSETRVHLAPFRTKAEAEQAMAKLRAMGYAPMLNAAGN